LLYFYDFKKIIIYLIRENLLELNICALFPFFLRNPQSSAYAYEFPSGKCKEKLSIRCSRGFSNSKCWQQGYKNRCTTGILAEMLKIMTKPWPQFLTLIGKIWHIPKCYKSTSLCMYTAINVRKRVYASWFKLGSGNIWKWGDSACFIVPKGDYKYTVKN